MFSNMWALLWQRIRTNPVLVTGALATIIGAVLLYLWTKPTLMTGQREVLELSKEIRKAIEIQDEEERAREVTLILATGLEEFVARDWSVNFRRHLALAFVVSGLLIIVVEGHTRWRATQEVGRDVLEAVLGKIVPPAVFKEVNDLALKASYIRKNLAYTFDIRSARELLGEEFSDYLLIRTTISWRVHNLSGQAGAVYPVNASLHAEPILHDGAGAVVAPAFTRLQVDDLQIELTERVLSPDGFTLKHDVELPGSELEFRRVRIEIQEAGYARDRAFWGTKSVVDTLTVQWNSQIPNFQFNPYLPHPKNASFRFDPEDPHKKTYPGVLLPGQGFLIEWHVG